MRRFLFKTILISLPIILSCGLILYILIASRESASIEQAIEIQQQNEKALYSCVVKYRDNAYKFVRTKKLHPEVLVLGTSRTMQIGSRFFSDSLTFYNAGGAVSTLSQFVPFLEKIGYDPQLLIVGLDQYFFNDAWSDINTPVPDYSNTQDKLFDLMFSSSRLICKNLLTGDIPILLPESPHIGLNAILKQDGFYRDGVYRYGSWETMPERQPDYLFRNTLKRIRQGNARFEYGSRVSEKSKAELKRLIEYCRLHNIYLVAFIPPFAPTVWAEMEATGQYGYIESLFTEIAPFFAASNNALFDFTYGTVGGSVDSEYVDGFHGGPLVYERIIRQMALSDSMLDAITTTK